MQTETEQTAIEAADALEAALEALLESDQGIAAGLGRARIWIAVRVVMRRMRLLAQQVVGQRGHQRARQHVGRNQRKDHRLGEGAEQIAGDTAQSEHRHEGDADTHQRYHGRDDDLLGAVQNCGLDLLAVFEMPVDILDCHRLMIP